MARITAQNHMALSMTSSVNNRNIMKTVSRFDKAMKMTLLLSYYILLILFILQYRRETEKEREQGQRLALKLIREVTMIIKIVEKKKTV